MEDNVSTMASEPAVAYTPTMFDTVISYLHSNRMPIETKRAVYRQLQSEVADENIANLKRRLKELSKLERGWDGYGEALPIVPATIDLMTKFLYSCRPSDVVDWTLSPNTNGTILLEQKDAAISISSKQFSYYAENGEEYIEDEGLDSDVANITEAIRKINFFMQQ